MIKVYTDEDFNQVYQQRKKTLYFFFGVLAVYLAICIACLCYHISLPFGDPNSTPPKIIVGVVTAMFVCFAFPFFSIKFYRVNRYYKMLHSISQVIKDKEENYFVKFEKNTLQKDNIDTVTCVFMTWNRKKQEWMRREVYFDAEKPLPEFDRGDFVRYITQSNFIVEYEILAKSVLEIDEINEYDEYGAQYGGYNQENEENSES